MEAYLKAHLDMGWPLFHTFLDNLRGSIEIDMGLKEKNKNLSLDGKGKIKDGFIRNQKFTPQC